MSDREFDSIIRFMGDATNVFATISEINARIQGIGKGGTVAGGFEEQIKGQLERTQTHLARLRAHTEQTSSSFERMAGHVVGSMIIWQGVNAAMNAVGGTIRGVVTETMRLDDSAARLSVTLGTSKEAARAYAQTYAIMGAELGMKPEEGLPQIQYAARVARTPTKQGEMFDVSAKLAKVTGEDATKLIDDLNVAYRQTGISVTTLGDMAVRAWQNSGTSASEYLNILREVGPLAQQSGIDIERMAGISALAADRMGGSMSDAANTLTRLIKATQEPNAMQFDVLTKYGIKPGGDVQMMLDQIARANMSAVDLAALGGRPGMPAVANDIRTMIAVFKEYNGELSVGSNLQESYIKTTDSLDMATKRLSASWDVLMSSMAETSNVTPKVNELSEVFTDAAKSLEYLNRVGLPEWFGQLIAGTTTGTNYLMQQEELRKAGMLHPYTGGMYQPGLQGQTVAEQFYNTGGPTAFLGEPITGRGKMIAGLETGRYELPTGATDISKFTQSQVDRALATTPQMMESQLQSYRTFLESLGIPPEKINEMVKAKEESIQSYMAMFQSGGQFRVLSGAGAYFLNDALKNISDKDTKASRQKDLEDRLKELTDATYENTDATVKSNQLQGLWNIPAGAKILVPSTGLPYGKADEGGGGGNAEARWHAQNERDKAKARQDLEDFMGEKGAGGGIPPETKAIPPLMRAEPTQAAIERQWAREDRAAAQADRLAAKNAYDEASRNSMGSLGGLFPRTAPIGRDVQNKEIGRYDISLTVNPMPVSISLDSKLFLDGEQIAQDFQRRQTQLLLNQARAAGALGGGQ